MKVFVRSVWLALLFFTIACDADSMIAGPVAVCSEAGEQCQLLDGPLGVCERTACRNAAIAPCYACVSQH